MKQYLGISRDHSRSMFSLSGAAASDYNNTIVAIQDAANANKIDTIVSVVKNGVGWDAKVVREVVNSNVQILEPISPGKYLTDGSGTPLFDSVGELITIMKAVPDYNDPQVSFLIMVITDGEENASKVWKHTLKNEIAKLQATDRWTFVFRVPNGYKHNLTMLGIPADNILEWDQTTKGLTTSTVATKEAFTQYYNIRSSGATSTSKFYADLRNVTTTQVKADLVDMSSKIEREFQVTATSAGMQIRDYVEERTGQYIIGSAYYQLTKTEDVQERKNIIIQNKIDMKYYGGQQARTLLGLPPYGNVRLAPHALGNYNVFIQSTSTNRKVVSGTKVLIVKN